MATTRLETIFRHLGGGVNDRIAREYCHGASSRYRYTLDSTILSNSQRQFYEQNGFIVVPKLVPDELLDKFRGRFIDICDGRVSSQAMTVMKDIGLKNSGLKGQDIINKIQDFVYDEVLFEYCRYPEVLKYVTGFTGPNVMAVHTMLINKPPDKGSLSSRHPLHQDLNYFPFRPADRIVCSWTAMERVNRENGCLVAIPGSHLGELIQHGYPDWEGGVNKMYHGIKTFSDELPRHYLEMEKGDTVFFHPILIHGSGANRTTGYRKAISCHYAASECEYIDVKGTQQEDIAKEVLEIAAKRGFMLTDYTEAWKLRARLIHGQKINL